MYNIIKVWKTGELEVIFFKEEKTDIVSMAVLPAGASEKIVPHREGIRDSVATKSLCKTLDFAFPDFCGNARKSGVSCFMHISTIILRYQ